MNCPYCKHHNAYVGLNIVECGNPSCMHFEESMRQKPKPSTGGGGFFAAAKSIPFHHPFTRRVKAYRAQDLRSKAQFESLLKSIKRAATKKKPDQHPMKDHGDFYFGD